MKVLLSAYACEPNRGSEPGAGWRWALELAKIGHQVVVLTRSNNRQSIEASGKTEEYPNLHFEYIDLPEWVRSWKNGARGVHLYYLLWQIIAYGSARRLQNRYSFDVIHHITFGVWRHPSFLAGLAPKFIFGPLGGGEEAPRQLLRFLPIRGIISELVRSIANLLAKVDPILHWTFRRSDLILARTHETAGAIPTRYKNKVAVHNEIGIDAPPLVAGDGEASRINKVLFVGRFVYFKGMHVGLRAFAQAAARNPAISLTLVGSGPCEHELRRLASKLYIAERISWIGQVPQDRLADIYAGHGIMFFPSLHDSGGNAVLEAMSYGLPVVCLNTGGPKLFVDSTCGVPVAVDSVPAREVVSQLGSALVALSSDIETWTQLSAGAYKRAQSLSWERAVRAIGVY